MDKERGCAVADADIDPITGENFSDMTDGKPRRGGGAGGKMHWFCDRVKIVRVVVTFIGGDSR